MDAPEYEEDDEEADGDAQQAESTAPSVENEEAKDVEETEANLALADWFKVERDDAPKVIENSDTETEDDSDHDEFPPEDGDEEWLKLDASPDDLPGPEATKVCRRIT